MSGSSDAGKTPLRSAMKADDDVDKTPPLSGSIKAVHIAEPGLEIAPSKRQHSAGLARRLSGRPALPASSSRSSIYSQASQNSPLDLPADDTSELPPAQHRHHHHASARLLAQVSEWLEHERLKHAARRAPKVPRRKPTSVPKDGTGNQESGESSKDAATEFKAHASPSGSIESRSSEISLDRLQRIVEDSMHALGLTSIPRLSPGLGRKRSGRLRRRSIHLHRTASSDTEYVDNDVLVPSTDAVLDNSKTMSYSGGKASMEDLTLAVSSGKRAESDKEKEAWVDFKNEVVRLAHTLKLKGWRRVPLEDGNRISIERLSGALTNAVYVVSPPKDLAISTPGKKPPPKLLLRVYGPQVEHLIDRENELSVLRRLARKKIGPRLLGTFANGRFEQFFNAMTLTAANLREPETSKQIAKRMRELHDGVDLLEEEKDEGPGVWKNWDRWLENAEKRAMFLDKQIANASDARRPSVTSWKSKGYVCGVDWPRFRQMVEKYREYLSSVYHKPADIRNLLVFAHNDTQYGNILRIRPDDEKSPLLQPANEHKQLIVIDFEYAAANVPGLEFANHFTEWTYNYHDPVAAHACNTERYPTYEQQHRFLKAYVDHQPHFARGIGGGSTPRLTPFDTPGSTPALVPTSSSSSIAEFMLDARVPPGGWKEEERKREEQAEARVKELMDETRLWRAANSAQWVAWGIVQAKIAGLAADELPEGGITDFEEAEIDPDEFDYLGYAQDRALFFWGDCVLLGLVAREELPEGIRDRIKLVKH